MQEIFIVDAVNYLFRSYYAIGPMTNDKGESTSALYGFIRSLQKLRKDFSCKNMIVVFDGPDNKKSRQEVYADYKMHRKGAPEDLYPQFTHAFNYCQMAGIPAISVPGIEADDAMASVAVWAEKNHYKVYICTTDKDLFQLVSKNVFVLNAYKDNLIIDAKKVEELLGVPPEQVLDLLAIMGDASDNIPGLEGFGPKTAASLLQQFKTLDNILEHPEKVPGAKKQETIRKHKDKAILSKKLATLDLRVKIPKSKKAYKIQEPDVTQLKEFYREMKFMKLLGDIAPTAKEEEKEEEKTSVKVKHTKIKSHYALVNTKDDLEKLKKDLKKTKEICIDTETTAEHPLLSKLVGVGFCKTAGKAWYVPCNGDIEEEIVIETIKDLAENKRLAFFGHNLKYDYHILKNYDIEIQNICFDTILASYLLNPQNRRHGLDRLALEYFDKKKIAYDDLVDKKKKIKSLADVDVKKVADYCCEDVDYTLRLKKVFQKELSAKKLLKLLKKVELPLLPILAKMERRGIYVDPDQFTSLDKEMEKEIHHLEEEIHKDVGKKFNINSPKQLSEILYKTLALPLPRKKTTEYSTAADVLEKLATMSPVVEKILQYRGLQKLLTTYIKALPKQINPETKRIHATFNQSITATGRLSCQDPNLQNIPIRSEGGKKLRQAFKPQKRGWSYISSDYSQIELRLLAHLSHDPELVKAFKVGQDIHVHTAALVFDVPIKDVTKKMRGIAKTVNFGILYGQGPYALSQQLDISVKKASEFIETYFTKYKKVKPYLEKCIEDVRRTHYATTLTGRKRPIFEIHNKNAHVRASAERLAINTPLQGTAADVIKMAMIEIDKEIERHKLQGFMILQIHDELLFEVPDEEIASFKKIVQNKMEKIMKLKVPLLVDIQVGKNWGEC